MNKDRISVFWFRRDLRLTDNVGLSAAIRSGHPVLAIFIFDKKILEKLEDKADRRLDFIYNRLLTIQKELQEAGSSLLILYNTPNTAFNWLTDNYFIDCVYFNRDYEPYALQRDNEISLLLSSRGVGVSSHKDQVIFEPGQVLKPDGEPYTIFTPYARKWKELLLSKISNEAIVNVGGAFNSKPNTSLLEAEFLLPGNSSIFETHFNPSLEEMGFEETGLKETGLKFSEPEIDDSIIANYHNTRNFPAHEGTTRLGTHLRFGTVSIRKLVEKALLLNDTWLNELIWREFFFSIIYHFPYVIDKPFKAKYSFIKWRNDLEEFWSWCRGETGFPIVDAGMRELNATGFMHNRVRMITASFLTKDLLIDWRIGETYFAGKLMDFELSSNNGNWQWAAGCGCDAAPYFRIFSPFEQTRKFDPQLLYIKKWIPELAVKGAIDSKGNIKPGAYFKPVVNHDSARLRVLAVYKAALSETSV